VDVAQKTGHVLLPLDSVFHQSIDLQAIAGGEDYTLQDIAWTMAIAYRQTSQGVGQITASESQFLPHLHGGRLVIESNVDDLQVSCSGAT
jgi:hypothetical protein